MRAGWMTHPGLDSADPQWHRTILGTLNAPVLVECEQRIVFVNGAYASLLGYRAPGELLHRHISCVIAKSDRPRLSRFSEMRGSGECAPVRYPFEAQRCDDSTVALVAAVSTSLVSGRLFITTVTEVTPVTARGTSPAALELLSDRERQVFSLLLDGKSPKEIGRLLDVSSKTVSSHRTSLRLKLGFDSDRDLFRFGWESGLLG